MFYDIMLIICGVMGLGCIYFASHLTIWTVRDIIEEIKQKQFNHKWEKEH